MAFSMMPTPILMVMLLGGGAGVGDLLDFTPTGAYWEMRDQRIVDLDTMSAVLVDEDATAADKLMAIRAIGELAAAQEADPAGKVKTMKLLTPLVESKEPFVGQYAKRSIAWIKGVEPEGYAPLPAEVYDQDLALLFADSTMVGQMKVTNGVGPVDLAAMIPDIKIEGKALREQAMAQIMPPLVELTQMIGNARVDLVTAGMILKDKEVMFMAVARGQYDRVSVQLALEEAVGQDERASFYSIGEVEVVSFGGYEPSAILMPSDEVFIVLFSDQGGGGDGVKLPIDEIAKKLQEPGRKPALSDVLTKQIAQIDREKAEAWGAMQVTPLMKTERELREIFGAFDAVRATMAHEAEGLLDIQWVGEGQDEAKVKETAMFLTEKIQEGVAEITKEKQHMPEEMRLMMDPLIEMMKSMTFKQDGKTVTGGMKIDPSVGVSMPMMMFGKRVQHQHGRAERAQNAAGVAKMKAAEMVEEAAAE